MSADSTRREFLTGHAAIRTLRSWGETSPNGIPPSAVTTGVGYTVSYSRRAMACEFQVRLPYETAAESAEVAVELLNLVDALASQLTIYEETSEISQLNHSAHREAITVEQRLYDLLRTADRLRIATGGAFDMATGELSKFWGFAQRAAKFPNLADLPSVLQRCGGEAIEYDDARRTIHFTKPGLSMNLGGIGKGYALDRCAELAAAHGLNDYLLHGGNSSILARGAPRDEQAWWVGVRDPLRPERRLCEIALRNRAVGTSGAAVQHFIHQGKRYGHLIDPRSGMPADGVLSTTVLAPTAAEADALATALYVLGRDPAEKYLAGRPDVAALIFTPRGSGNHWDVSLHNLAEEDCRISAA